MFKDLGINFAPNTKQTLQNLLRNWKEKTESQKKYVIYKRNFKECNDEHFDNIKYSRKENQMQVNIF